MLWKAIGESSGVIAVLTVVTLLLTTLAATHSPPSKGL